MSQWKQTGAGYRVYSGALIARIIRKAGRFKWYGGACEKTHTSVPLHGPYLFKWMAKMEANTRRKAILDEIFWEEHGLKATDALD